jgi:glucose-6-phosphate 1-dehydrogenase
MAEDFGVEGRGIFYDQTGATRDVIQNHLLQVITNLAMERPLRTDGESIRDEKAKVLKAINGADSERRGARSISRLPAERGVAPDSNVETFTALRLEVNSRRWQGVPLLYSRRKALAGYLDRDLHST